MAEPAVRYYGDGGIFMEGRYSHATRGIYWSVVCEDPLVPHAVPAIIRKQDFIYYKTNNDAEWMAVREALMHAVAHYPTRDIIIFSDSQVIVKQFCGQAAINGERHQGFNAECQALAARCQQVIVQWVPRTVMVEKLGH